MVRDSMLPDIGGPARDNDSLLHRGTATGSQPIKVPPSTFLVVVLAAVSAVPQLAIDMYLPGFPALATELNAAPFAVQLTLTAFMVGLAGGQLVIGPLSDQFGRRRLLLAGSAVCALATALCAMAPSVEALIAGRLLQGISGAAGVVLARAVLADRASGAQAARLFSLMMAIQGLVPILAPLAGGAIVPTLGWRGVFWILTGLTVLLGLLALLFVQESLPKEQRRTGGVAEFVSLTRAALINRNYIGYCLAVGFSLGALFCYIAASPFILQENFGLGAGWFAVAFAANSGGLVIFSLVSAKLVYRFSPATVMLVGLALMVGVSAVYAVLVFSGGANLWATLALFFLALSSLGFVLGNATALAVEQMPHAAGTAMAVMGAAQYLIGAAAASLVGLSGEDLQMSLGLGMLACALMAGVGGWTASRSHS